MLVVFAVSTPQMVSEGKNVADINSTRKAQFGYYLEIKVSL